MCTRSNYTCWDCHGRKWMGHSNLLSVLYVQGQGTNAHEHGSPSQICRSPSHAWILPARTVCKSCSALIHLSCIAAPPSNNPSLQHLIRAYLWLHTNPCPFSTARACLHVGLPSAARLIPTMSRGLALAPASNSVTSLSQPVLHWCFGPMISCAQPLCLPQIQMMPQLPHPPSLCLWAVRAWSAFASSASARKCAWRGRQQRRGWELRARLLWRMGWGGGWSRWGLLYVYVLAHECIVCADGCVCMSTCVWLCRCRSRW